MNALRLATICFNFSLKNARGEIHESPQNDTKYRLMKCLKERLAKSEEKKTAFHLMTVSLIRRTWGD